MHEVFFPSFVETALLVISTVTVTLYVQRRRYESSQRFMVFSLVENANDAIIGKTLDGMITYWNRAAEMLFGFSSEMVLGKKMTDIIIPPELSREEFDILAQVSRGEIVPHFTTRRNHLDGRSIDVSVTVSPIALKNGTIIGASTTIRDMTLQIETEQKVSEEEIREINAKLENDVKARTEELEQISSLQRIILRDSAHAIIATDTFGIITVFNACAEAMLGYEASEVIGKTSPTIFHDVEEIKARAIALTQELKRAIEPGFQVFATKAKMGIVDGNEWTYIRKDAKTFPILLTVTALIDKHENIIGYLGMIVDLTEQKAKDRALQENDRFLKAITDNIPSLVGYWDKDLRCRFANFAYENWFGVKISEMHGLHLSDLLSPELLEFNVPYIENVLQGKLQQFERDIPLLDGRIAHTWAHYIPDVDEGIVQGFYMLVSDITDLKKTEIKLASVNSELQTRTVEAEAATLMKSQFLANMSHEIRSPMNAILGMLQLLSTTGLTRRQTDYADKAYKATQSLLHLLNDILDLSKIESGKLEIEYAPFSFEATVQDILSLYSGEAVAKLLEIICRIDRNIPKTVVGDALRLRQVLANIVGNAIKFTDSGEIFLEISLMEASESIHASMIRFSVLDTGIGIPAKKIDEIFQIFSQAEASTARDYGGSGLGLSISSQLIALMGGVLEVESQVGIGSTFSFSLSFAHINDVAAEPINAIPSFAQSQHVLVIEKNETARSCITDIIRSFGWPVESVASLSESKACIASRQQHQQYDVIMIDSRELVGVDFSLSIEFSAALDTFTKRPKLILMGNNLNIVREILRTNSIFSAVLLKPYTSSSVLNSIFEACQSAENSLWTTVEPPSKQRLRGTNILVVDDNDINLQIAYELLTLEGAIVKVADSGEKAIGVAERKTSTIDIVLMDVQMPKMDGYETTRRFRLSPIMKDVPILAMTANAMEQERLLCLEAGMNDHIAKPINLDVLVETILQYVKISVTSNDLPLLTTTYLENVRFIDLDSALARLGNNRSLFMKIASQSIHQTNSLMQEIHELARVDAMPQGNRTSSSDQESCRHCRQ